MDHCNDRGNMVIAKSRLCVLSIYSVLYIVKPFTPAALPPESEPISDQVGRRSEHVFKVVCCGDKNVGKTSFILCVRDENGSLELPESTSTTGEISSVSNGVNCVMHLHCVFVRLIDGACACFICTHLCKFRTWALVSGSFFLVACSSGLCGCACL